MPPRRAFLFHPLLAALLHSTAFLLLRAAGAEFLPRTLTGPVSHAGRPLRHAGGIGHRIVQYSNPTAKHPNFEPVLDVAFDPLTRRQFAQLRRTYGAWSPGSRSRVRYERGRSYSLLDFLPPALQATWGLCFLPEIEGGVHLHYQCYGFALDALSLARRPWPSRWRRERLILSCPDSRATWSALVETTTLVARGFDARGGWAAQRDASLRPGDVVLVYHDNSGAYKPGSVWLDHVAIWLDDGLLFEKAGSGASTPFRLVDAATFGRSWDIGGVFRTEVRRPKPLRGGGGGGGGVSVRRDLGLRGSYVRGGPARQHGTRLGRAAARGLCGSSDEGRLTLFRTQSLPAPLATDPKGRATLPGAAFHRLSGGGFGGTGAPRARIALARVPRVPRVPRVARVGMARVGVARGRRCPPPCLRCPAEEQAWTAEEEASLRAQVAAFTVGQGRCATTFWAQLLCASSSLGRRTAAECEQRAASLRGQGLACGGASPMLLDGWQRLVGGRFVGVVDGRCVWVTAESEGRLMADPRPGPGYVTAMGGRVYELGVELNAAVRECAPRAERASGGLVADAVVGPSIYVRAYVPPLPIEEQLRRLVLGPAASGLDSNIETMASSMGVALLASLCGLSFFLGANGFGQSVATLQPQSQPAPAAPWVVSYNAAGYAPSSAAPPQQGASGQQQQLQLPQQRRVSLDVSELVARQALRVEASHIQLQQLEPAAGGELTEELAARLGAYERRLEEGQRRLDAYRASAAGRWSFEQERAVDTRLELESYRGNLVSSHDLVRVRVRVSNP